VVDSIACEFPLGVSPTGRIVDELRGLEDFASFAQTSTSGAAHFCPGSSRPGLIRLRPKKTNSPTIMTAHDFRRIALSFEGVEAGSHMGQPDFRVGRKIFATLASEDKGYGNLKLSPEQQAEFVATEEVLTGALRTAWKLRVDRNAKSGKRRRSTRRRIVEP